MSKSVYMPVEVHEDGTFYVDFEGAPWMYVDSQENVWDDEEDEWESGSIESDNADVVDAAEEWIARAGRLLTAWLKVEERVAAFVEKAGEWEKQRQAIFDAESETGHLDHSAIWDNDDTAVALAEEAAAILEGLR